MLDGGADRGDADAGGDEHVALAERERLAEHAEQALGERHRRALRAGGGVEHHVLVAREAGHGGALGHGVAQPLGDHHEHLVAGGVAERVVDVLEPVEVDEEQRRVLLLRPRDARSRSVICCSSTLRFGRPVSGSVWAPWSSSAWATLLARTACMTRT